MARMRNTFQLSKVAYENAEYIASLVCSTWNSENKSETRHLCCLLFAVCVSIGIICEYAQQNKSNFFMMGCGHLACLHSTCTHTCTRINVCYTLQLTFFIFFLLLSFCVSSACKTTKKTVKQRHFQITTTKKTERETNR